MNKIQLLDLQAQYRAIKDNVRARMDRVLEHGHFIMGPEINELEERLARFAGVKHAVACSSGTDALILALMAYDVGPGDAVFTSNFTFIATAEGAALLGATPVFVDIDPVTKNMDPADLKRKIQTVKQKSGLKTRGIIPVDLFGLPADYKTISEIAKAEGLFILEDAAQSFGSTYEGKRAGSLGHIAATSFFPAKPLGCYGDGGAVFTDEDAIAEKLKSIRVHGQGAVRYQHLRLGLNARMDTLQAAVLLAKLDVFEQELEKREKVAAFYSGRFKGLLELPYVPQGRTCSWAQYSVTCPNRETVRNFLAQKEIPTAVYYPVPLHRQLSFSHLGYEQGEFPVSDKMAETIWSLPMHPYLSQSDLEKIAEAVLDALKGRVAKPAHS